MAIYVLNRCPIGYSSLVFSRALNLFSPAHLPVPHVDPNSPHPPARVSLHSLSTFSASFQTSEADNRVKWFVGDSAASAAASAAANGASGGVPHSSRVFLHTQELMHVTALTLHKACMAKHFCPSQLPNLTCYLMLYCYRYFKGCRLPSDILSPKQSSRHVCTDDLHYPTLPTQLKHSLFQPPYKGSRAP